MMSSNFVDVPPHVPPHVATCPITGTTLYIDGVISSHDLWGVD